MILSASSSVGGIDLDGLEASFEGTVFFDRLSKFRRRRRPDTLNLAARKSGLQNVRRVECALGRAGTDERVQLVDKDDIVRRSP